MIGEYLRNKRKRAGFRLVDLSNASGVSVPFLSDIENNRSEPSLKTLCAIADVYGMGAGDLLVEAGYTTSYDRQGELISKAEQIAHQLLHNAISLLKDEP